MSLTERPYRVFTGTIAVMAECMDCGWTLDSKNAMGVGAQHSARYGHEVMVTSDRLVRFVPRGREKRQ